MIIRQAKEYEPLHSVLLDGVFIYDNEYSVEKYISGKDSMMEYIQWYPYAIRSEGI